MYKAQTRAIIKPLAFQSGYAGPIITQIDTAGFRIKVISSTQLSVEEAKAFYAIHEEKPFYENLCAYMASAPIIVMVLEKEHAIEDFRKLIGATNPAEAARNTLRQQFGKSIDYNAVHGSDAPTTAKVEIGFFFAPQKSCCGGNCGEE